MTTFSGLNFNMGLQNTRDPDQRRSLTPNISDIPTPRAFDTSLLSILTRMTRAEALAQALPFEDERRGFTNCLASLQSMEHIHTGPSGSQKRQKVDDIGQMHGIHRSPRSLTPEVKVEDYGSYQPLTLPLPANLTEPDLKPTQQQPKKRRPNQRTNIRAKMLWTDEETADLIKGVNLFGYGRWKKVLNYPDLKFLQERTAVDLKDRYRTCLNNGWATNTTKKPPPPRKRRRKSDASVEFFPPYPSDTPPKPDSHYPTTHFDDPDKNSSTIPPRVQFPVRTCNTKKVEPTAEVPRRKQKQPWTRREDTLLWAGYKKHGFKWRAIAKDYALGLTHRRSTAIRDRFRLMLPSLYMDNVDIEDDATKGGKRKIHWSLRKLVGRDLDGPDPVLLALSEEGPGEEEGEATFTDQEDEDGDEDGGDDGYESEASTAANSNVFLGNVGETVPIETDNYSIDPLDFDFSASEPLLQRFFNDEDFDLGYDEEADEDYFDDGVVGNGSFPRFPLPPEFVENPPNFSELWNDNDGDGRDDDSEDGTEDGEEQHEQDSFDDYLVDGKNRANDEDANIDGGSMTAAAPLLWEEMATQPIFDLEDDE